MSSHTYNLVQFCAIDTLVSQLSLGYHLALALKQLGFFIVGQIYSINC